MRPPVVCVVLPIPRVEVSRLKTEGALTKMANLLTGPEFFAGYFLKHPAVAVASVTAEVQGAAPYQAVSIGVKDIVDRQRNRKEVPVADRNSPFRPGPAVAASP